MLNIPALLLAMLATVVAGVGLSWLGWRRRAVAPPPGAITRRLAALECAVVILIAPVLLFPTPTRMAVAAVIPVLWLIASRAGAGLVPRTPLNPALWSLLLLVALSTGVTFDVAFSLGKIAGVMLGVLTFWALVRWMDTPERLRLALAVCVCCGVGLALLGLFGIEKAGTTKSRLLNDIVARLPILIRGVPGAEGGFSPNPVAGCLALFLPLQLAMLAHRGLRNWMLAGFSSVTARLALVMQGLALFVTLGTVTLMQSRGTWLGLLLAAAVGMFLRFRPLRWGAAGLATLVVVGGLVAGPSRSWSALADRVGPRFEADVSVRLALWTSGLRGIQDAPITGHGLNTFRRIMMERYPIAEISAHYHEVAHAHNNLIQAALDLGLPGLAVYLSLWMSAAWMVLRLRRDVPGTPVGVAGAALGLGLVAHFTFGMTDAIPLGAKVGILFWISLAVVTSAWALRRGTTPAET